MVLLGCVLGCGGPTPEPAAPRVLVTEAAPSDAPGVVAEPKREPPLTTFAPSPVTELANRCVAMVRDVIAGRMPTSTPFPLAKPLDLEHLLKKPTKIEFQDGDAASQELPVPPGEELDFFLFALELELIPRLELKPNPNPSNPPPDAKDVKATLVLSRVALKVGELKASLRSSPFPEVEQMKAVGEVGRNLRSALCEDRMDGFLFGPSDRTALGGDRIYQAAVKEVPTREDLAEVRAILRCDQSLEGFAVGDINLAARTRNGEIYTFEIDVGPSEQRPVLDGRYLVKARKVDLERDL